jgi:hypothetical protein
LTYPELQWRKWEDWKDSRRRRGGCVKLVDVYRCAMRNVAFPVFRYLLLNVLFEVLAEDDKSGLSTIQSVYTFIGLVESLLLSMMISPVTSFQSFLASAPPGKSDFAYASVFLIVAAMGISFLNLLIIVVLHSYLSGVHKDHLHAEVKALPVFGVPAFALVGSVFFFVLWFIAYIYVAVDWIMPVLVFTVCGAALVLFFPILVYLFVFRLPHLRRTENERRKKVLGIPASSPLNVMEQLVEEDEAEQQVRNSSEFQQREAYIESLHELLTPNRRATLQALQAQEPPASAAHNQVSPLFHEELTSKSMERLYWGLYVKYAHDKAQTGAQSGKTPGGAQSPLGRGAPRASGHTLGASPSPPPSTQFNPGTHAGGAR